MESLAKTKRIVRNPVFFDLSISVLFIQGALVGGLVSLNLVAWISFGTQAAISTGSIHFPVKPVSVEGCSESLRSTAGNFTLIVENAVRYTLSLDSKNRPRTL